MRSYRVILPLVLLALIAAPFVMSPFYVVLMLPALAYGVILLGFNLLFGYTGLMSFGHALFVALGAYSVAYVTGRYGIKSMETAILTAIGVSLLIGIPVGMLCVRYVKIFFGMLTLAFGMLFYSFLFKFYDLTGGDSGIPIIRPSLLGMEFADLDKTAYLTGPFYFYSLGILLLLGFLMWRIVHSPFGLHLRAIRDNPRKAEYVGVRVYLFRLTAYVISAVYGAIGGALLSIPVGLADPELAYWTHSGNLVFMTILGGFGNFFGPLLGAFVFIGLQNELMSVTQYWRFALGVILILIVIALPRGLMGLLEKRGRPARDRKIESAPAAPSKREAGL
ncbi:MAG TPA: branched-chain amino acid ABC transporter permease [Burkholderiaceae bacterium]|jgi:branched-chain amino acid transport system permease protein|nr:branched-chain amino acid ABC transporter permease [Burkholderiaceae bacterium]